MDPILGMNPTGRRVSGPAADLVEVESAKGLKHTVIELHDEFVEHPAVIADCKEFGKFMENPGVTGIAPLKDKDHDEGWYLYATGQVWSVAEVVRIFADMGETCGIRAGLELAYVTAQILQEAEEAASKFELFNHGSLSPWNVLLRPDGQVVIIGYGLAQVEVLDFLEDESLMPKEDSFRYAPPERLEDEGEDLSSDLFSLSLIALELMTGRPVYDGLINDIRQQATRAEGAYRLYKWRTLVPDLVREALGRALKYDVDARYTSATDFVYAVHDLIGSPDIEGPSLHEVMRRVRNASNDKPLQGGHTALLTKEEMARLAAELDDDDDPPPLAPPKRPRNEAEPEPVEEDDDQPQQRWGKVERPGRKTRQPRGREGRAATERRGREVAKPGRTDSRADSRGGSDKDALRDRLKRGRTSEPARGVESARGGAESARGSDRGDRDSARRSLKDSLQRDRSRTRDDEGDRRASLKDSLRNRLRESAGRRRPPDDDPPPREPEVVPEDEVEEDDPVVEEEAEEVAEEEETEMAGNDDDASSSGGAAALLARLRSSAGARSSGVAARLGSTKKAEEPDEDDAPAAPPPAPRVATAGKKSGARSSGDRDNDAREVFDIVLHGKARKTKLRLGDTLSQVADRLGHALAALPTDLMGNLTGWYRIEQGGEWIPGHETTDVLDASKPVDLVFVHARIVPLVFDVDGDPKAKFQAPVSTTVPAKSIVTHIVGLLGLPAGSWRLHVDGQKVEPLQILEDFEVQPGQVIKVSR